MSFRDDCLDKDFRLDPARPQAKARDAEPGAVRLVGAERPAALIGLKYSDPLPTFEPEKRVKSCQIKPRN